MNEEELVETLKQIKEAVWAKPENKDKTEDQIDEIILDGFFQSFCDGKITKEDLCAIAVAMGYEPTEEFLNNPTPDPINERKK